ncbi:hypothetical protein [Conchiformibius steedae]|uniref:secretion/conjugation apparatus DotM-related subunit n=1 Tax=Conchiformibius steedae TaxID=153493 RepID=UPI0026F00E19|nr:hypothetical protein [Conchiformibius steedae]
MTQQYNGQIDPSQEKMVMALLLVVFLSVGTWAFYWFWKTDYLTLKMYQFRLLDFITDGRIDLIHQTRLRLDHSPAYEWTFGEMVRLSYLTDYVLVLPLLLAVRAAMRHIDNDLFLYLRLRHRNLHVTDRDNNIDALTNIGNYVTENGYDEIKPVWGLNLLQQDAREGPWASARKPHDIAARFGLFKTAGNPDTLDEDKARRYFTMQLGRTYLGEHSLSDYHKAIIGVLLAYIERDNNEATQARRAISRSYSAKLDVIKPDYRAGLALFEQYKHSPLAAPVFQRHAYINSLILGLYTYAKQVRKIGVCPAHYFIWLKPLDRLLYYALNNEGRDVAWTECAGIVNHTYYETEMGKAIFQPYVDECILAFRTECQKVIPEIVVSSNDWNVVQVDGQNLNVLPKEGMLNLTQPTPA